MVDLFSVLWVITPPTGGEILLASLCCIIHQHLVLPSFPGVQSPINSLADHTGLGDVLGALEGRFLEDNEPLRVPEALPDSCEFYSQCLEEAAPNSPARRIIPPRGHDRQGSQKFIPRLVFLDPPTEVCSIVGVHPVPIHLPDPSVLPCGHVHCRIPRWNLPVLRLICRFPCCCCCRHCFGHTPLS